MKEPVKKKQCFVVYSDTELQSKHDASHNKNTTKSE